MSDVMRQHDLNTQLTSYNVIADLTQNAPQNPPPKLSKQEELSSQYQSVDDLAAPSPTGPSNPVLLYNPSSHDTGNSRSIQSSLEIYSNQAQTLMNSTTDYSELSNESADVNSGYQGAETVQVLLDSTVQNTPPPLTQPTLQTQKMGLLDPDRDWNAEYQQLNDLPDSKQKFKKLRDLAQDFLYCAQTFAVIIIR